MLLPRSLCLALAPLAAIRADDSAVAYAFIEALLNCSCGAGQLLCCRSTASNISLCNIPRFQVLRVNGLANNNSEQARRGG